MRRKEERVDFNPNYLIIKISDLCIAISEMLIYYIGVSANVAKL